MCTVEFVSTMTPAERAALDRKWAYENAQLDELRARYREARTAVAAKHGITDIPAFEEMADEFFEALALCVSDVHGTMIGQLVFEGLDPIAIEGIADLGTDNDPEEVYRSFFADDNGD